MLLDEPGKGRREQHSTFRRANWDVFSGMQAIRLTSLLTLLAATS